MKLYQLNKGQHFKFYIDDKDFSGEFLGMDGMFGKVKVEGIEEIQFLSAIVEVYLILD